MGRATEFIAYINSEPSEWRSGKIKYEQFKYIDFTEDQKEARKNYRKSLKSKIA